MDSLNICSALCKTDAWTSNNDLGLTDQRSVYNAGESNTILKVYVDV